MSTLTRNDHIRRVVVVLAEIFCVVGTLVGVGVLGTSVSQTSGVPWRPTPPSSRRRRPPSRSGASSTSASSSTRSGSSCRATRRPNRVRSTGWLAAVSMVLNAAWLLVTQQGWIWVSVVVILALAVTLGLLVQRLSREPARDLVEKVVLDGTFGLYLGWVAVATCANVTAALVDSDVDLGSTAASSPPPSSCSSPPPSESCFARALRGPVGRRGRHGLGPGLDRRRPPHRRAEVDDHRGRGRGRRRCRGGGGRPLPPGRRRRPRRPAEPGQRQRLSGCRPARRDAPGRAGTVGSTPTLASGAG